MPSCTCGNPTAVAKATTQAGSTVASAINAQTRSIATTSGIAPLRFCHWAAPEVTPTGYNLSAGIQQGLITGIAILNSTIQGRISDLNQELGENYYDMANFKWNRFKGNYMPLEKKLLQEVSTVKEKTMNCGDDRKRAQTAVNTAYSAMEKFLSEQARKLRICVDPSILGMVEQRQTVMLVDTENFNLVDDQYFTDVKNDQRWNRRSTVLNLGRGLSSTAMSYGDVAKNTAANVSAQTDRAFSSLASSIGYLGSRNNTNYPTTFTSSGSSNVVSSTVADAPGMDVLGGLASTDMSVVM